ncbi:MAG: YgiT-type zinc finger protein [Geobacteraceae bacterium]
MQSEEIQQYKEMDWFSGRARESRFRMSEHVVRFLVAGKVTVTDIKTVLLYGVVLEERQNQMRGTSYLVYGDSDGKPVHLVCADGRNGWLLVLFAYLPALPVWASPTRRNDLGGGDMTESVGKCFFCGGNMVKITMGNYDYRREGQLCIVKKLPASLCQQCGEKYINADVGEKLNALIDEKMFSGSELAAVIDYAHDEGSS